MTKTGAIILAAGMSKRMETPKLLLPLNGAPMIYHPIALALQQKLNPIVVIAGQYIEEIKNVLKNCSEITYVYNPDYQSGMASSLKLGIQTIAGQVDAAMIFLGDQPFVHKQVVRSLQVEYENEKDNGVWIVRPCYAGQQGHPILFDHNLFGHFATIKGDEGGRSIIRSHKNYLKLIDFSEILWGMDIDTPEDYEKVRK